MFSYIENACTIGEFDFSMKIYDDNDTLKSAYLSEPSFPYYDASLKSAYGAHLVQSFMYGVRATSDGGTEKLLTNQELRNTVTQTSELSYPKIDKTVICAYNFFDRSNQNQNISGQDRGDYPIYLSSPAYNPNTFQGTTRTPGLPGLYGTITGHGTDHSTDNKAFPDATGVFSVTIGASTARARNNGSNTNTAVAFNPAPYNNIYGNSPSVTPATFTTALCIGY